MQVFQDCESGLDGGSLGALFGAGQKDDPIFPFSSSRLLTEVSGGKQRLEPAGETEKRPAERGKPNRRCEDHVIALLPVGDDILHLVRYAAAGMAPAKPAVQAGRDGR